MTMTQQGFELLLAELEGNALEVALVPSRRCDNLVRVAIQRNADWYRRFCARHGSSRRRRNAAFDTRIKRRNVVAVLTRLIETGHSCSKYAPELRTIAARLLATYTAKEAVG